jgi:hypothetical protein
MAHVTAPLRTLAGCGYDAIVVVAIVVVVIAVVAGCVGRAGVRVN